MRKALDFDSTMTEKLGSFIHNHCSQNSWHKEDHVLAITIMQLIILASFYFTAADQADWGNIEKLVSNIKNVVDIKRSQ